MPLAVLQPGEAGTVTDVLGEGPFRRRLLDMGFIRGAPVRVIKLAPLMNPIEYCVGGTHVTLRRKEAMHIVVERREACEQGGGRVCKSGRHGFGHGKGRGKGKGRRWWRRSASE